jgi:hypothetical protein
MGRFRYNSTGRPEIAATQGVNGVYCLTEIGLAEDGNGAGRARI